MTDHLSEACLSGQSQQQQFNRHSRAHELSTTVTRFHIFNLNSEESLYGSKSSIRARNGDHIYARFYVPWSRNELTVTLMASWTAKYTTTPLWLFMKKTGLPTTTDYDKTSISFVSRKYSRIKEDGVKPGQYFVMMEALTDLHNITMTVSIMPTNDFEEKIGFVESNHISPHYDAIP